MIAALIEKRAAYNNGPLFTDRGINEFKFRIRLNAMLQVWRLDK